MDPHDLQVCTHCPFHIRMMLPVSRSPALCASCFKLRTQSMRLGGFLIDPRHANMMFEKRASRGDAKRKEVQCNSLMVYASPLKTCQGPSGALHWALTPH